MGSGWEPASRSGLSSDSPGGLRLPPVSLWASVSMFLQCGWGGRRWGPGGTTWPQRFRPDTLMGPEVHESRIVGI